MTALRKTQIALNPDAAPFAIRAERASDVVARETLLDACFGDNRHTRTCQRLRDGRAPAEGLALSALAQGRLVGTLRLWHVSAGGTSVTRLITLASASQASRPLSCRCPGRSNAIACSASNCATARSTAPGE